MAQYILPYPRELNRIVLEYYGGPEQLFISHRVRNWWQRNVSIFITRSMAPLVQILADTIGNIPFGVSCDVLMKYNANQIRGIKVYPLFRNASHLCDFLGPLVPEIKEPTELRKPNQTANHLNDEYYKIRIDLPRMIMTAQNEFQVCMLWPWIDRSDNPIEGIVFPQHSLINAIGIFTGVSWNKGLTDEKRKDKYKHLYKIVIELRAKIIKEHAENHKKEFNFRDARNLIENYNDRLENDNDRLALKHNYECRAHVHKLYGRPLPVNNSY